jgi:hypothetical protein
MIVCPLMERQNATVRIATGRRNWKTYSQTSSVVQPGERTSEPQETISGVFALLRAAENWGAFKRGLDRAYPKFGTTIELALAGGDSGSKRLT